MRSRGSSAAAAAASYELDTELSTDQIFMANFIMMNYLGPDVYSDIPRCSALHRQSKGLPPYTSNNLAASFLTFPQLESLYYYILRNAHPSLVLEPNKLYLYLKGNLNLQGSWPPEDHVQFTSFFPLNLHEHKRYSASHEVVKGIVLIHDPVTSCMKKEDLERFRRLSGLADLNIDSNKCLCYQRDQNGEDTIAGCKTDSGKETVAVISKRNERSSAMFREKYKRRRHGGPSLVSAPSQVPLPPATTTVPELEDCISNQPVIVTGTARLGIAGPPIGVVDIGISEAAYFFRIALPGVRRDFRLFSCEIESDGKVHIEGSTKGGRSIKKRSRIFEMKRQQMCPPGPFAISFNLPGPVDPRLFSPSFRSDGILEAVVVKHENRLVCEVKEQS